MANKKITAVVIDALEDIKARDIKLINVTRITSVFDYIAVASADSTRQTKALARNVMDRVKEAGGWIYGTEGEGTGEWVLVDCGDVVVHIMQPAVREHYKLEELWGEGKVEFPKPARAKPVAKAIEDKPVKAPARKRATTAKTPAVKTAAGKVKAATGKSTVLAKKATTSKKPAATKPAATRKRAATGTGVGATAARKAVPKTTPKTAAKTSAKTTAKSAAKAGPKTTVKAVAKAKVAAKKPAVRKRKVAGE